MAGRSWSTEKRGGFRPKDIVNLYPSYGFMPASDAVRRLAKTKKLDEEELALVGRFIKGTKGG